MQPGTADVPAGDAARGEAVRRLRLTDAPQHAAFDRIARLARDALGVPSALVSVLDEARGAVLLGADGLPVAGGARERELGHAVCRHVVGGRAALLVEDARRHPLLQDDLAIAAVGAVACLGLPLVTMGGEVVGALCAIDHAPRAWTEAEQASLADLAALAQSELALRELAAQLDSRIRAEAAARQGALEERARKRRLEALGQLAGGVAHDFANVLQAVQAGVRMANLNLERDPAKARRLLEAAAEAARRGGSVTRRLLGFARRGELRVRRVAVAAVLADLEEVLVHTLNRPGLTVLLDTEADLPTVLVDRGELETVLVNLATNARDALPQGGTLVLSAHREMVAGPLATHASAGPPPELLPGHYVRLAATDDGTGMSAETLARAAEPFFTTKPEGEGTGLGLAMARDFAVQAGGGFALRSAPGAGTAVTLWLPAADTPSFETTNRVA